MKARSTSRLPGVNGEPLVFTRGARRRCAGDHRRDGYTHLKELLCTAVVPQSPIAFTIGVDTQATERNWCQINRHKTAQAHAGRHMHNDLLHRVGHSLNLMRWDAAVRILSYRTLTSALYLVNCRKRLSSSSCGP